MKSYSSRRPIPSSFLGNFFCTWKQLPGSNSADPGKNKSLPFLFNWFGNKFMGFPSPPKTLCVLPYRITQSLWFSSDFLPKSVIWIESFSDLRQRAYVVSIGFEKENHWKAEAVSVTSVYGPSHEERGVFLQVPAVTSCVHPRDLEDSLFLRTV